MYWDSVFWEYYFGINIFWVGYGRLSGEECEMLIILWDFCIISIILDCVCMYIYVKICLFFREYDVEWDREGEKKDDKYLVDRLKI